jgi:hypothetical protein
MTDKQLERNIIVVGKTGGGKSYFLNELQGANNFESSPNQESCTEKISVCSASINVIVDEVDIKNVTLKLNAFDTPGIADTKGRSKKFLNTIAQTIRSHPFNLIIILVEYGKHDTSFCNNLEIFRECLNELSQSSSMLIVNKVPTKKYLDKKRGKGEKVADRELELKKTFELVSLKLGIDFKFKFFLQNDEYDEYEKEIEINKAKYDAIRRVIWSCGSLLNGSKIKTWDEIVAFYSKDIKELTAQELSVKMEMLKLGLEDKLVKIEFDIADMKYPFLRGLKDTVIRSYLKQYEEFVSRFRCGISEEDYWKCKTQNSYITMIANTANALDEYAFGVCEKAIRFALDPNTLAALISGADKIFSLLPALETFVLPAAVASGLIATFSLLAIRSTSVTTETIDSLLFYNDNKNVEQNLSNLGTRRETLRRELKEYKDSMDNLKEKLVLQQEKVYRLKVAL